MVENHLVINEIQLGTQLNECVHSQRRSDFSLMLAMLTDDAREFSEFLLPEGKEQTNLPAENQLRKHFDLPKQAPLAIDELSEIDAFNQATLANNDNMAAIHLANVLQPKAIAFRDNAKYIEANIVNNTNLHCQKRYQRSLEQNENNSPSVAKLSFNAKAWLKTVQQSIVTTQIA